MESTNSNDNNLQEPEIIDEQNHAWYDSTHHPGYPPKPSGIISQLQTPNTWISLIMFIAIFGFLSDWDWVYLTMLIMVLVVHETGHYLAMKYFKYEDLSIFFIPLFGAGASGTKEDISQKEEAFVLLAGPVPGVIIGSALYVYSASTGNEVMTRLATLFIYVNIFNLLPILPLDGGRLIKTMFFNSNETITMIFNILSIIAMSYAAYAMNSYFFMIIPALLVLQVVQQFQMKKVKRGLDYQGISLDRTYDELSNKEYWLIRDQLGTHVDSYSKMITPNDYTVSPREHEIIKKIKSMVHSNGKRDMKIGLKIFLTIIWIFTFIIPLIFVILFNQ